MTAHDLDQRLSRIATRWTIVFQAHGAGGDMAQEARQTLLQRYGRAVYRYLLAGVRDADAAEELAQEFALKLVRGDFRRVAPERGKFRHYLKTVLSNLITDHHRERQARPGALGVEPAAPAAAEAEPDFFASWREELLERTWKALAAFNPTYHAALQMRVGQEDLPSEEMAAALTAQLGKPVSAALARKAVQRGREKFAEFLLDEVASSLESPSDEELQRELAELDLLRFCRGALEKRAGSPPRRGME
jgi:RNA polymerase sigma factor (sigma-70 family)